MRYTYLIFDGSDLRKEGAFPNEFYLKLQSEKIDVQATDVPPLAPVMTVHYVHAQELVHATEELLKAFPPSEDHQEIIENWLATIPEFKKQS